MLLGDSHLKELEKKGLKAVGELYACILLKWHTCWEKGLSGQGLRALPLKALLTVSFRYSGQHPSVKWKAGEWRDRLNECQGVWVEVGCIYCSLRSCLLGDSYIRQRAQIKRSLQVKRQGNAFWSRNVNGYQEQVGLSVNESMPRGSHYISALGSGLRLLCESRGVLSWSL